MVQASLGSSAALFVLIWSAPHDFVYEGLSGAAEQAAAGRGVARTSTLAQALALGKRLGVSAPQCTYSVYKLQSGEMILKGAYPKRINVKDARIRFRRRAVTRADGTPLGVGGMGDDIWRELMERDNWGEIDDAWAKFRKTLELGRELDFVDEQGHKIDFGADYPPELTDLEDEAYD